MSRTISRRRGGQASMASMGGKYARVNRGHGLVAGSTEYAAKRQDLISARVVG